MRALVQRISHGKVTVKDTGGVSGEIDLGLLVLLGVKKGDTLLDAEKLANKLVKLRIMADTEAKMNLSILETSKQMLVVSQFTLYGNTTDGNRPSFIQAEEPSLAQNAYEHFVQKLTEYGVVVTTGLFGKYMHIDVVLDGPVTLLLES